MGSRDDNVWHWKRGRGGVQNFQKADNMIYAQPLSLVFEIKEKRDNLKNNNVDIKFTLNALWNKRFI